MEKTRFKKFLKPSPMKGEELSPKRPHEKLNAWFATAICGNDILSSTLYVSGIAIIFAGVWAPVVLLLVVLVLYFYKAVYTEVVEALPMNGGAYNCLLNGTLKTVAAIAGVITFLSYVATAVISAKVGVEYVNSVLPIPVIPVTIALLGAFALLIISGLKDSAKVALGIFVFHIVSLVAFLIFGVYHVMHGGSFFAENYAHTSDILSKEGGFLPVLYLAFSASLLGVSGFESSANFVEEQKPGVFRKTLRNMLIGVGIFNPLIALAILFIMPFPAIAGAKDFLLANAAYGIGGHVFQYWIVADAFLVLSGAILTAYVGVSGLINRMASDNCLPVFFTKRNTRGSYPRIAITFFFLCSSILLLTRGNLLSLAGVYTIAFLSVMTLFAIGNLILRESRPGLKRTYHAPMLFIVLAGLATFFGIIGNIRIDEQNLSFFEIYFIPAVIIVLAIVYQDSIFKWLMRFSIHFPRIHTLLKKKFEHLFEGNFIAFIRNQHRLFEILEYIHKNETGSKIVLIYCDDPENPNTDSIFKEIEDSLPVLRSSGVFPHFEITLVRLDQTFSPQVVEEVAKKFNMPKNRIFIGSLHDTHTFEYGEFGGVRIIL